MEVASLNDRRDNVTYLRRHGQCRIGFATLDLADVFPAETTLTSEAVFAQPTAFSEFLKPPRQPLANARGVVVGVVVVRCDGYGNSCGVQNGQRRKH